MDLWDRPAQLLTKSYHTKEAILIEVDIPSIDPIQHEPKLIFGMTLRQAICVIVGGVGGVGAFLLMHFLVPGVQDLAVVGFLLFALPAVLMGWYKPYNMKAEEYLKIKAKKCGALGAALLISFAFYFSHWTSTMVPPWNSINSLFKI